MRDLWVPPAARTRAGRRGRDRARAPLVERHCGPLPASGRAARDDGGGALVRFAQEVILDKTSRRRFGSTPNVKWANRFQ